MHNQLLIPLVLYLAAVFALALFTRRRAQQGSGFLSEYLLGNRSMGGFVLAMTLAATYASASSFIGGPGAAYKMGLGWVLLAMIQLPAAWLTLGVLGKKFAIEARKHNALTLNDMLYARYQHRGVVVFASLALLLAFFRYHGGAVCRWGPVAANRYRPVLLSGSDDFCRHRWAVHYDWRIPCRGHDRHLTRHHDDHRHAGSAGWHYSRRR